MSRRVWDASALLALLGEEPGSEALFDLLPNGVMSSVNLSEVAAKLGERGMPDEEVRDLLNALPLSIHSFDQEQAYRAGAIRESTRQAGLSFGDRACLALASVLDEVALTADRVWAELDLAVRVELCR